MQTIINSLEKKQIKYILEKLNGYGEDDFDVTVETQAEIREKKKESTFRLQKEKDVINVGFDTEDNSCGDCHLVVFYFPNDVTYVFNSPEEALIFLIFAEFEKDLALWCVNTEYDLNNLNCGYDFLIDRFYNKSRLIFAQVKKFRKRKQREVRFLDLINFYSLSAAQVGKLFGLDKLEFDFNKNRRYRKDGSVIVSKKEITYCKRDAQIAQVAGQFISDKFGEWDIRRTSTVASCAMQIYLKHYQPSGIDFTRYNMNNYKVTQWELYQSYFGGRTEAFYIGELDGDIKYYDVNSLYPFVMQEFEYPNPYGMIRRNKNADIEYGAISCRVRSPRTLHLPILPTKMEVGNGYSKLVFPVGTFEGVWTAEELNYARSFGYEIEEVYWAVEYLETVDLFYDYIHEMYRHRMESKTPADNKFYKVLMNSLYGKFGEKRRLEYWVPVAECPNPFAPIHNDHAMMTELTYPIHTNVIVASYVTSLARIHLHKLMIEAENNGAKMMYCDTDSLIYKGKFEFPTGKELGELKLEHLISHVDIRGPKYYSLTTTEGDTFYVCKGVPKSQQEQAFLRGEADFKKPIRYKESKRRKMRPNIWLDYNKKLDHQYDKRIILKSGWTKPIVLS